MFGLIILGALGIYFLVIIAVTWFAYYCAAKNGSSFGKRLLAAAVGFLIIYLPVFWDHIPTIVVHNYYCEKEAGFWVYKTLDQWRAENPRVSESLVANKNDTSTRQGDMVNYIDTYFVNKRFNLIVKHNGKLFLNRWRHERQLIDISSNEVLARFVDFSTSQEQRQAGWSGWKIWLDYKFCSGGRDRQIEFGNFYLQFKGAQQ